MTESEIEKRWIANLERLMARIRRRAKPRPKPIAKKKGVK